jgi:chromosome partitioning protein
MIVSMVNVKGGVGKTTTAVNLSAAFAGEGGLRTLLVDLDPQGSATFSLGVGQEDANPSALDLLLGNLPVQDVIRETDVEGLHLISGSMGLAGADLDLARKQQPQRRLAHCLAPIRRRYDMVIIDCPPGLGVLTLNGLGAAHAYLVPVVPRDLDMEALNRCLAAIDEVQGLARKPALLGVVLTMVDQRTRVTDAVVEGIRHAFGSQVLRTEIPINVRLAEAPGYGRTIFDYEGWSTGARAYRLLGGEVLKRARKAGLL